MQRHGVWCAILIALQVTASARADTIYLKRPVTRDGSLTIDGTIIQEDGNSVTIQTSPGMSLSFDRSQIDRIEYDGGRVEQAVGSDIQDFYERLERIPSPQVEGLDELETWARSRGLDREACRVAYERRLRTYSGETETETIELARAARDAGLGDASSAHIQDGVERLCRASPPHLAEACGLVELARTEGFSPQGAARSLYHSWRATIADADLAVILGFAEWCTLYGLRGEAEWELGVALSVAPGDRDLAALVSHHYNRFYSAGTWYSTGQAILESGDWDTYARTNGSELRGAYNELIKSPSRYVGSLVYADLEVFHVREEGGVNYAQAWVVSASGRADLDQAVIISYPCRTTLQRGQRVHAAGVFAGELVYENVRGTVTSCPHFSLPLLTEDSFAQVIQRHSSQGR